MYNFPIFIKFLSGDCDRLRVELLSFDRLKKFEGKIEDKFEKMDIWIGLFKNKLPLLVDTFTTTIKYRNHRKSLLRFNLQ